MDKRCPNILNVGPHRIIGYTPIPGYLLPRVVLDNANFYMCKLTAAECDALDYNRCQVYINNKEKMLEKIARKK